MDVTIGTFSLEISPIVLFLIIFIIAFFLIQSILVLWKCLSLWNELKKICQAAKTYGGQATGIEKDKFETQIKNFSRIYPEWKEFHATLFEYKKFQCSSESIDKFFGVERILRKINLGWYSAVPGILTGLGLLGTFGSLLLGLNGLNVEPNGKVQGIAVLINGLSGKFISSIAGLLCSLLFIFLLNGLINLVRGQSLRLQHELERLFPIKTSQAVLSEIYRESEKQTGILGSFTTDLSGKLKESFQESLTPQVNQILNGIDKLCQVMLNHGNNSQDSLEQTLKQMVEGFQASLTGNASSQIDKLAENLEKSAGFLTSFDQSNQKLQERMAQMLGNLDAGIASQQQQSQQGVESLAEIVRQLVNQVDTSATTQNLKTQENLERVLGQVTRWANDMEIKQQLLLAKMEESSSSQQESFAKQLSEAAGIITRQAATATMGVEASVGQLLQKTSDWSNLVLNLQNSQSENISVATNNLKAAVESFTQNIRSNQSYFEQMNDAAAKVQFASGLLSQSANSTGQAQQELSTRIGQVANLLQSYQDILSKTALLHEQQQNLYQTLDVQLGSLIDQIQNGTKQYINTTRDSLITNLTTYDNHLAKTTSLLGDGVENLEEQLDKLNETLNGFNRR